MPTLLDGHILRAGAAPSIVDSSGTVSWSVLGDRVARWIGLFHDRGLREGDRLAVVLGNRRETFEVLLACLHAGIVLVPVNWHLAVPEIRYLLEDSASAALVTEPEHVDTVSTAAQGIGHRAGRLVLGTRGTAGFEAAGPLLRSARPRPAGQERCGALMLYTSGTTGQPKGVDNGLFVVGAPFARVRKLIAYARAVLDVPAGERVLLDGPWYHSAQLFFALLALLRGSCLVIRSHFDPAATLATIDRERITSVHLVPTQFVRLLRLDPRLRRAFRGASLRRVWHGGGPCPVGVKRQMIDWWGPVLLEYYGATEAGAVTLIDSAQWLRRPGSVGRALPPGELLVVGAEGTALPPGQIGQVFVRRRTGRTFRYHNAADKTRAAHLTPDTFTYGELGYLDDEGFLYLTGRASDTIVSGGVNVYPAEVEAVLVTHPAVRDAAVLGVPDDEFGERVVAVVEPAAGTTAHLARTLTAHCRRALAGFKVPTVYHFVDALPREASGKLRRDTLRERYAPGAPVRG